MNRTNLLVFKRVLDSHIKPTAKGRRLIVSALYANAETERQVKLTGFGGIRVPAYVEARTS